MPEKDPTTWSMASWLLIIGMSIAGGVTRLLCNMRDHGISSVSFIGFLADLATSGLVGVATYMTLISFGYPVALCAAAAGMCGHMATRIIFISFSLTDKFGRMIGRRIDTHAPDKKIMKKRRY